MEPDQLDRLREQLRRRLEDRYSDASSWEEVAEGSGYGGEYLRQMAKGEKEPPERTVLSLLRWIEGPITSHGRPKGEAKEPSREAGKKEVLAWIRWIYDLAARDMLPEIKWEGSLAGSVERSAELLDRLDSGAENGPEMGGKQTGT